MKDAFYMTTRWSGLAVGFVEDCPKGECRQSQQPLLCA